MPVILAAPGTGKSHWVGLNPRWSDADEWAASLGLHTAKWHASSHTEKQTMAHYRRIDAELEKLPADMFMIGSLYWDFVPDAIVLIDSKTHRDRVQSRPDLNWDQVSGVVQDLESRAATHGVPIFKTFDAAAAHVEMAAGVGRARGAFRDAVATLCLK